MHDPTILLRPGSVGRKLIRFFQKIGFDGIIRSEAIGFSGGIWVTWRKKIVDIHRVNIHRPVVTVEGLFFAIYNNPSPINREMLWEQLLDLKTDVNHPWLLMGDFNETLNMGELSGIQIRRW
ncbi:LOW QUALITY PROTEIN: hypothetical protein V2J09_010624 [Rumex salicifolius]